MALDAFFQNWLRHTHPDRFSTRMDHHIEEIAVEWSDYRVHDETEALDQENRLLKNQIEKKDALISELRLELGKRHQELKRFMGLK